MADLQSIRAEFTSSELWKKAEQEIKKIQPPTTNIIEIEKSHLSRKSIDEIYKQAPQSLTTLMKQGSFNYVKNEENVPQSVKMLDYYAQKMGFLPMGAIVEGKGSNYIGRTEEITDKGEKFYNKFPNFTENAIDTPNLTQNLTFKANNAIEKWNEFVSAEADLADFLEKIKTPEGRKKLIFTYAKTSSTGSDALKILSSLYYLYIDPKSQIINYLDLPPDKILKFKKLLVEEGNLMEQYVKVLDYIKENARNNQARKNIETYHEYKILSLRASLSPGEFQEIEDELDELSAYVSEEMIGRPSVQQSEWFRILTKEETDIKLVIDRWNPKEYWFRPYNYLK